MDFRNRLAFHIEATINDKRLLSVSNLLIDSLRHLQEAIHYQEDDGVLLPLSFVRLFPFYACRAASPDFILLHLHVAKTAGTYFANRLFNSRLYTTYSASLTEGFKHSTISALPYMLGFLADIAEGKIPLITGHYSLDEFRRHGLDNPRNTQIIATIRDPYEIPLSLFAWQCTSENLRKSPYFTAETLCSYGCDPASMSFEEWLNATETRRLLRVYERAFGVNYDSRFSSDMTRSSLDTGLVYFLLEHVASVTGFTADILLDSYSIPRLTSGHQAVTNGSIYSDKIRFNKNYYMKLSKAFLDTHLPTEHVLYALLETRLASAVSARIR